MGNKCSCLRDFCSELDLLPDTSTNLEEQDQYNNENYPIDRRSSFHLQRQLSFVGDNSDIKEENKESFSPIKLLSNNNFSSPTNPSTSLKISAFSPSSSLNSTSSFFSKQIQLQKNRIFLPPSDFTLDYKPLKTLFISDNSYIILVKKNNKSLKFSKGKQNYFAAKVIKKNIFSDSSSCVLDDYYSEINILELIQEKSKELQSSESSQSFIPSGSYVNNMNIINYIKYYDTNEHLYILYNLLYEDILDYLKKRKIINEKLISKIFKQILNAVNFLHLNNIIHRDLRPENIMVEYYKEEGEKSSSENEKLPRYDDDDFDDFDYDLLNRTNSFAYSSNSSSSSSNVPYIRIINFRMAKIVFDPVELPSTPGSLIPSSPFLSGSFKNRAHSNFNSSQSSSIFSMDKSIDMWSLGILLFVLVIGRPPLPQDIQYLTTSLERDYKERRRNSKKNHNLEALKVESTIVNLKENNISKSLSLSSPNPLISSSLASPNYINLSDSLNINDNVQLSSSYNVPYSSLYLEGFNISSSLPVDSPLKNHRESDNSFEDSPNNFTYNDPYIDILSLPLRDLLFQLLHPNPRRRITAQNAIKHPWISQFSEQELKNSTKSPSPSPISNPFFHTSKRNFFVNLPSKERLTNNSDNLRQYLKESFIQEASCNMHKSQSQKLHQYLSNLGAKGENFKKKDTSKNLESPSKNAASDLKSYLNSAKNFSPNASTILFSPANSPILSPSPLNCNESSPTISKSSLTSVLSSSK